jgi:hypothetical protein
MTWVVDSISLRFLEKLLSSGEALQNACMVMAMCYNVRRYMLSNLTGWHLHRETNLGGSPYMY